MQLTISLYLLGFGCGQIVCGPLADSFGRKHVLVGGIALFVLGSALAALSFQPWQLLAVRMIQALGGAAALLAARAIIADSLGPERMADGIAMLMTATLLSPMIGPTIGGVLVGLAGWRSIFWLLGGFGIVVGILAARLLRETLVPPGVAFRLGGIFASYAGLATNRVYMRFVLANALIVSALYVFMSGSPFLLIGQFGFTPEQAGLFYLVIAGATILGTFCVSRLERSGIGLGVGTGICVLGGALMLALDLLGAHPAAALLVGMLFVGVGAGITTPTAMARAMGHAPDIAGTASSLAAAVQMLGSAITTALVAALHLERPVSLSAAILALTLLASLIVPRR
jgi:DHA1 family bicyclomycin/chloramphenicol resistance-like MFS transporter